MRAVLLAICVLCAAPAVAVADAVVVGGRGWGHGVGLSQYGAYGYALRAGRDHRFILAHYFAGSGYGTEPAARMRVRLKRARAPRISGATVARAASGRRVRLAERRTYVFRALGGDRVRVLDAETGRARTRMRAPVTVHGRGSATLRGLAENGLRNGAYRGSLVLVRDGGRVLVVNRLSLEHYLYGVVPAEMPATWPVEALRAQAVVARSYALRSRRTGVPYDLYADVRSQVYRGVLAETAASTAAVRATRAAVVTAGGEVAQTFFFSTSGGRTAANEEGFGGAPISYLRSVDDPYDDVSPYHTWTARFTERQANRKLRSVRPGRLRGLAVASRTPSGRAATVAVRGSQGTRTVPATTVQALLGLRSTWITSVTGP
jgi:SpoIID/LytB domain protein